MRKRLVSPLVPTGVGLGLALLFLVAPGAQAQSAGTRLVVTNCNDAGDGSLRAAVARAASGDTLDMRGLRCGRITLTSGPIEAPQTDLTLLGPGRGFHINGNDAGQVLRHTGSGRLRIVSLSMSHGRNRAEVAAGGCLASAGQVELRNAQVHHCVARATGTAPAGNIALGGGVYAAGDIDLFSSAVFANLAEHDVSNPGAASGGGVMTGGRLTSVRSDVVQNRSTGDGGGAYAASLDAHYSQFNSNTAGRDGGGVILAGTGFRPYADTTLASSTVARNHAARNYGGAALARGDVVVIDSTISDNVADAAVGGLYLSSEAFGDHASVANSTIAFNMQNSRSPECGALYWDGGTLLLDSSIVARNTCAGRAADIEVDVHYDPAIIGANNLVMSSTVALPADTLATDPALAVLADNGGPTRTHALRTGSPAIDRGNNEAGLGFDQRGRGVPRVNGAAADIGAFER